MNIVISKLIKMLPSRPVLAHCDIPCGIYDPHQMQLAAHTILRMTNLLLDAKVPMDDSAKEHEFTEHHNSVVRMIAAKEKHGEICEQEIATLWADYFKEEHLKDYPELHNLVWETIKLSSKVRQVVDVDLAEQLLAKTQQIAEIFWRSKGMEPIRIPSTYPTKGEMVVHK